SWPRVGSGDVARMPDFTLKLSGLFFTCGLARVEKQEAPGRPPVYRLGEVAGGTGVGINGKDTIISPDSYTRLGAKLALRASYPLGRAYHRLDRVLVRARSDTLVVYDAPVRMVREGRNQNTILRSAVLVDSHTGDLELLTWAVAQDDAEHYLGALDTM